MARIQKWASGWNSLQLPGMVFNSKQLLMAAITRHEIEDEINPLLKSNKVEETFDDNLKYKVLGIPNEFGEWFLRFEEQKSRDGRIDDMEKYIGTWSVLRDSGDQEEHELAREYDVQAAYKWVMNNYKNQQTEPQKIQGPEWSNV